MREMEFLLFNEIDVLFLVETHHLGSKFKWSKGIDSIECQRSVNDKKGGGIMAAYRPRTGIKLMKLESSCDDLLGITYEESGKEMCWVVAYWDVRDEKRNEKIEREMRRIKERHRNICFVGDFNAHWVELDGRKNKNGIRLKDMVEEEDLVVVNTSDKCVGKWTWERNDSKTVIDYWLTDRETFRGIRQNGN